MTSSHHLINTTTLKIKTMNTLKAKNIIALFSVFVILAGGAGMIFCFPFLWSARMEDLVGAGFPFLGGAVLLGSGLVSLALLYKE